MLLGAQKAVPAILSREGVLLAYSAKAACARFTLRGARNHLPSTAKPRLVGRVGSVCRDAARLHDGSLAACDVEVHSRGAAAVPAGQVILHHVSRRDCSNAIYKLADFKGASVQELAAWLTFK